jgi:hypothetical protein
VGGSVSAADGGPPSLTADVFYAPLSSAGIGTWAASTHFPHVTFAPNCVTDSGTIYCISASSVGAPIPDAYYASISSSGVGTWAPTTAPPALTEGCSAIGGYVYCFGGGSCPPTAPDSDCYSHSYFAPLTASGIGAWQSTTELPTSVSAEYAAAGNSIYYLSIPVFFASVSAGGIGPWQTTTNYPQSLYPSNCFSSGANLYCGSPVAGGSYFAPIGVPNPKALQLRNPPPFPRSEYLAPAWENGGGGSVSAGGVTAGVPMFDKNIDDAVVFDCAAQASTSAGCTTTVVSSNTAYNYDMTIWYPCTSPSPAGANCCFLPKVGYSTPFNKWCVSVGSNSFIIAGEIAMMPAQ